MFVLIFGRIADMVGRKRIFLTGTAFVYKNESAYAVITELPDIVETAPGMAVTARINKENDMTPMQAVGG
jgi:MFS family permease